MLPVGTSSAMPAVQPREPPPPRKPAPPRISRTRVDQFSTEPILLRSPEGLDLLKHCAPAHLTTLPAVMSHFEAPDSIYEAGIASATMVVNALGLSTQPILDQYRHDFGNKVVEFPYFTNREVIARLDGGEEAVLASGTTLDQIEGLLKACGTHTEAIHVDEATPAQITAFRQVALTSLQNRESHLLVNFLGLDGRGYHSPIAAYDQGTDRFLVYNVLFPRPQPVWMSTEELVRAMATQDPVSGLNRGYVLARAIEQAGASTEPPGQMCVPLDTVEGTAILQACEPRHLSSLPGLMTEHQVQFNLCTSGPTSLATIGNDLGIRGADGSRLTQQSLIELLPYDLQKEMKPPGLGLNLQQLTNLVDALGAEVYRKPVVPLEDEPRGVERFRRDAIAALESPNSHVILNFDRKKIGQRGRGHFSPIAAYNSTLDMFLIYETAPFRVDPVWVSAKDLHNSMAKYDDEIRSNRVPRGYLIISNPDSEHPGEAFTDSVEL